MVLTLVYGVPGILALVGILLLNLHLSSAAARLLRRGAIDQAQSERAFVIRSSTLALMLGGTFLSAAYSPIVVLTGALGVAYSSTLPASSRRMRVR